MESWQRFFHNKRKQNIQDEMFYPWPSNNSESKSNFMNSDLDTYYLYKKNILPISKWGINGFFDDVEKFDSGIILFYP